MTSKNIRALNRHQLIEEFAQSTVDDMRSAVRMIRNKQSLLMELLAEGNELDLGYLQSKNDSRKHLLFMEENGII
jgi:hypothetical protein